mmetsp:Transcript_4603/g.10017  ORF Transcript_4603/g.10017 Transcript_4603/m.10017 type:complete len:230 (+) Transcript_4603:512-1201(+)
MRPRHPSRRRGAAEWQTAPQRRLCRRPMPPPTGSISTTMAGDLRIRSRRRTPARRAVPKLSPQKRWSTKRPTSTSCCPTTTRRSSTRATPIRRISSRGCKSAHRSRLTARSSRARTSSRSCKPARRGNRAAPQQRSRRRPVGKEGFRSSPRRLRAWQMATAARRTPEAVRQRASLRRHMGEAGRRDAGRRIAVIGDSGRGSTTTPRKLRSRPAETRRRSSTRTRRLFSL